MSKTSKKDQVTTWVERFQQSIAIMCGGNTPPLQMCLDWMDKDADSVELQEWAINHAALPWAQGIGILDAASVLADHPMEGFGHLPEEACSRIPKPW